MKRAPIETIEEWYSRPGLGLGIVGGRISGNLEALDFDDNEIYGDYCTAAEAAGLGELVSRIRTGYEERTPAGGVHLLYRCEAIEGNQKLANRPNPEDSTRTSVLIETRGEGGFIITAPSNGRVHPSGRPWTLLQGGFDSIETVTPDERTDLLTLARSFDETPRRDAETSRSGSQGIDALRPGDAFRSTHGDLAGWRTILEPHGWVLVYQRGTMGFWRRPGKNYGISATTGHAGTDLLYVFSSSTLFETESGISPFSAYVTLNYGGDFAAAAAALRAESIESHSDESGRDEHLGASAGGRQSQATVLARTVIDGNAEFFHDMNGTAFVTFEIDGHHETWPIASRSFRDFMLAAYYREHQSVPGLRSVQDATANLEGRARYDGEQIPVALRSAWVDRAMLVIDLGDEGWTAVKVSPDGWELVNESPVRFRRSPSTRALPLPAAGGDVRILANYVNVHDGPEGIDFLLTLGWIIAALLPSGPYPILDLAGEQGGGKSTAARVLRRLIDPRKVEIASLPRDERDLASAAVHSRLLIFDNVSGLSEARADQLCRLATGGGWQSRKLYSDDEEHAIDAIRPILLTGIPDLATRSDLADRTITLELPGIRSGMYRSEQEFWSAFDRDAPAIFGALLDLVAHAIRNLSTVGIDDLPRMADFARIGEAMLPALGRKRGDFIQAMRQNLEHQNAVILEAHPEAIELVRWLGAQKDNQFTGTASELLIELKRFADLDLTKSNAWPKSPKAMSENLRRLKPNLALAGVGVSFHRQKHRRTIELVQTGGNPASPTSSPSSAMEVDDAGDAGDALVPLVLRNHARNVHDASCPLA